ncbi:MAG: phospholipase D-like domain-containing protein [Chloroflexota bacterium]
MPNLRIETKPSSLTKISVLTNISMDNVLSKSLDTSALRLILDEFQVASIVSLPYLHAKVFVADKTTALVTSANFTNGGLWKNYEYGVVINGEESVRTILDDISAYMNLGGAISREFLNIVEEKLAELSQSKMQIEMNIETKSLRKKVQQSQLELQDILLANRVRKGQTINALFCDTILLILRKHKDGLATEEIHTEVQLIHPDICDDAIDRVINGQHYGKRWKHYVRRAQEYLKEKRIIARIGAKWRLDNAN